MYSVFQVPGPSTNGLVLFDPRGSGASTYFLLLIGLLALHLLIQAPDTAAERLLGEVCLVLPAALLYFLVRGLTNANPDRAFAHAEMLVGYEQRLGLYIEPRLQGAILEHPLLVHIVNWIYVWGHWPVIFIVFLWLWNSYPHSYPIYRNAMLISGAIGMILFALYPVAPPRLVPELGFVDTVTLQSRAYRLLQPPALANPYAAMPSLHFGWNLIVGLAIVVHSSTWRGRIVGCLLPVAMFAAIMLTANHYLFDGLAGGIVALTGLGLALAMTTSPRNAPRSAHAIVQNRRLKLNRK
ncbi:MAG: phosphatase PAP2 family protein [Thermomicrobiales bacterium]|nr:phosphatase PAP2 family protein [Thermomicrobiales bacterium]